MNVCLSEREGFIAFFQWSIHVVRTCLLFFRHLERNFSSITNRNGLDLLLLPMLLLCVGGRNGAWEWRWLWWICGWLRILCRLFLSCHLHLGFGWLLKWMRNVLMVSYIAHTFTLRLLEDRLHCKNHQTVQGCLTRMALNGKHKIPQQKKRGERMRMGR